MNLPAGVIGKKILSTPDGGFLVLAGPDLLRFSSDGKLVSTWVAPGSLSDFTLDDQGNLYVAGTATTNNIPIIDRNSQSTGLIATTSFFAKLDTSYASVLALGGFGDASTKASAIAVDPKGNVYVGGTTFAISFPDAFNPSPPPVAGVLSTYAFAVKIPPTADRIVYSVLLGGPAASCNNYGFGPKCATPNIAGSSTVAALAVDASGSLTIAGNTFSNGFPITPGAIQGSEGTYEPSEALWVLSGFVTKVDPTGSKLVYATCLGSSAKEGSERNLIQSMHLAPNGNAVVAGPNQVGFAGGAFIEEVNATGTGFVFQMVFSGSVHVDDTVNDMKIDSDGNMWITGLAFSPNFAGVPAPSLRPPLAYVARISADGSGVLLVTYLPSGGGLSISVAGNEVLDLGASSVTYVPVPSSTSTVSDGVFNAISQHPESSVAPGEFVTIYGANLNNATVDFYGVTAPILYAGSTQVNVISPWNLQGPINVWNNDVLVKSIPINIGSANLQLLALTNADGSINSPINPAPLGSTVTAYLNGASYGAVQGQFPNGSASTAIISLSPPLLSSAGLAITYQGSAPGLLNEVQQVNLLVSGPPPGSHATLSQGRSVLTFDLAVSPNSDWA